MNTDSNKLNGSKNKEIKPSGFLLSFKNDYLRPLGTISFYLLSGCAFLVIYISNLLTDAGYCSPHQIFELSHLGAPSFKSLYPHTCASTFARLIAEHGEIGLFPIIIFYLISPKIDDLLDKLLQIKE